MANAPSIKPTSYAIPSGAYFVSTQGSDSNSGTSASPFRTIKHATVIASGGSTIVVRSGTYREDASFSGKSLTIQPYPNEAAWMNGADIVTGWVQDGITWRKDNWTTQFIPTQEPNILNPSFPAAKYPDQVFVNEAPLTQVLSKVEVTSGKFYVDYANAKLYIGTDPTGQTVEASTRVFAFNIVNSNDTIIRGLGIRNYSPHYEPNQSGSIRVDSDNTTFENNTIIYSANNGLTIFGVNAIINGNIISLNGEGGLSGNQMNNSVISNNIFSNNNTEHFALGWDAAGAKLTNSTDVIFSDNIADHNEGPGFWCDTVCSRMIFVRNVSSFNTDHGLDFEKSGFGIIASNIFQGNADGVSLNGSNDTIISNNDMISNGRVMRFVDDTRRTGDPVSTGFNLNNTVKNNIFSDTNGTADAMVKVDDTADQKTGAQMITTIDYDDYYRHDTSIPVNLINWETGAVNADLAHYQTLAAFKAAIGKEQSGRELSGSTNPFFVDLAGGNFHLLSTSPSKGAGQPLPVNVADAINHGLSVPVVTAGSPIDRGAIVWAGETSMALDMIVTDIIASPSTWAVGDQVTWSAVVKNVGDVATPSGVSCDVSFAVDGAAKSSWSEFNTTQIAPGASATLLTTGGVNGKRTWTALAGTHTVTAFVDFANRYGALEPNKANNSLDETFITGSTTVQAPDAVLNDTAITFAPAAPVSGQVVTITKAVRNAGNVEIDAGSIDFSIDGTSIGTVPVPVIAAGASANVSKTWSAVTGTHSVVVTASNISGSV